MTHEQSAFILACAITVGFVCVVLAAVLAYGCAPNQHDARSAVFAAELLACVHDAGTRAESQACREGVERRWGHPHE